MLPHISGGLDPFEQDIVAVFVDIAAMMGFPRSYGEIYGLLYASPKPLSFTDIHERLQLSKGSVSQGLRALRDVGAIRPAPIGNDRREHFIAETELRSLLAVYLNESIHPQLVRGTTRLDVIKVRHRSLLTAKNGDGRLLQGRVDKLQSWHRKGAKLLPLVARIVG